MATWRFIFREMRKRSGRTILTFLSIVIGVTSLVSVRMATTATREAYAEMFRSMSGRASLQVLSSTGVAFPQDTLELVSKVPGVDAAVPTLKRPSNLFFSGKKARTMAIGIVPELESKVRETELVSGRLFQDADEIVVDQSFSQALGIKTGDTIKLFTKRGLKEMQVVGVIKSRSAAAASQGGSAWMSLSTAQTRFNAKGQLDAIDIVIKNDAERDQIQRAIAAVLPEGIDVQPPATQSHLAEETMLAAQHGLNMAKAFSVVLAVFVIMNTFFMNVAERRRPMAIMRAIGATRRQIMVLLLQESLLLGIFGAIAGLIFGGLVAKLLGSALGNLFQVRLPPLSWDSWSIIYAFGFGPGMALIGAFIPAYHASKLSPLEGMSWFTPQESEGTNWATTLVGAILLVQAAIGLTGSIQGWMPIGVAIGSAVMLLVGVVFLIPVTLRPLTWLGGSLMRPWMRVETRLARREALRNRWRTALTIGVLFIATSTGIGLASSVLDNIRDVRQWYRKTIVGDFFVRALVPDMATGLSTDLPEEIGEQIEKVATGAEVIRLRFASMRVADSPTIVVVRDYFSGKDVNFDGVGIDPNSIFERLSAGEVVLGSVLSRRIDASVGDEIPVETADGEVKFRVAAIVNDYFAGGLAMHVKRDIAKKLLGIDGTDAYVIKAKNANRDQIRAGLETISQEHGLLLQSFADIARTIESMIIGIVACLWGLLALGFLVAAFGVINTLTMNVLEQTRQMGLLRVVAMTRRQVRRTILAQAVMMGVVGLVPGIVAGEAIAYFINLSTMPVTGHPVEFVLRPDLLAGSLGMAMIIVLAASWIPAERAARIELSTALQYQ